MGQDISKQSDSASSLALSDNSKKHKNVIKLISYNIKVNSYSENKFDNIFMYITFDHKNILYCLQGVYDNDFRENLNKSLKNNKYFSEESIIPSNVNDKYKEIINKCGLYYISTFPIISYDIHNFSIKDQLLKTFDNTSKGVLTINTKINNNYVSIYNVCLQNDIKGIINCANIRKKQLKKIFSIIDDNHKKNKPLIHIIIGSLYEKINDKKIIDSVDIKSINIEEIYTNIMDRKKYEYIYFYMYHSKIDIVNSLKEIGVEIIDNNIKNNITFAENYPYELILKKIDN